MPAPTSYTMDTFEDYLKYEVLQETAFSLGWAHDLPETPVTWNVILVEVRPDAYEVRVEPLKYHLAPHTDLTFVHRVTGVPLSTVTVSKPAYPDDEHIFIDPNFGSSFELEPSVNYRAETTTPIKIPLFEQVFEPAIRDTLAAIGVEDITTITSINDLIKLRARGRMEIWKRVKDFTSFDYVATTEGAELHRDQIYDKAVAQYQLASGEYFSFADVVEVEVKNSERASIKVVW